MLILDKHKAVDHMVALAVHLAETAGVDPPADDAPRQRSRQKVAKFERRARAPETADVRPRRRAARGTAATREFSPA